MKLKLAAFAVLLGLTTTFLGACDTAGTDTDEVEVSPALESPGAEVSPMMSPSPSP